MGTFGPFCGLIDLEKGRAHLREEETHGMKPIVD